MTLDQVKAVLLAADTARVWLRAYIVLSLLVGARTEELRELAWTHVVAYDKERQEWLPVTHVGWEHEEFAVYVWRSVRAGGDTKTKRSRRSLKLPTRCIRPMIDVWDHQQEAKAKAGDAWQNTGLVFATRTGTARSAGNVRREFRRLINRVPGLVGDDWTEAPRV